MSQQPSKTKPGLSFSTIFQTLLCSRTYYFEKILKVVTPSNGNMIQGNVYHAVIEHNLRQKVSSKIDLPLPELQALFETKWDEAIRLEDILPEDGEDLDFLKSQGPALIETFYPIMETLKPLLIERQFRISLGPDFPFDLTGKWDLIDEDNKVRDAKVKTDEMTAEKLRVDLQFSIYCLAYRLVYGEIEGGLIMDQVVKGRGKKRPNYHAVSTPTERSNADLMWTLRLIEDVANLIAKGAFVPNPTSWKCSPKNCSHWDRCSKERSKTTIAIGG